MGFDEKFVKQAMLENIEKKSIGHTTARALVEAVQELERWLEFSKILLQICDHAEMR